MVSETFRGIRLVGRDEADGRVDTITTPGVASVRRPELTGSEPSRAIVVAMVAVAVALTLGRLLDIVGLPVLDFVPYLVAVIAVVIVTRGAWAGAAGVMIAGPLLIARSVLTPTTISALAPIVVSATALLFLVVNSRRARLRPTMLIVVAIAALLVVPAVSGADRTSILKGAGVGVMWVVAFVIAANLGPMERRLLGAGFVIVMLVESLIAMSESFLQLPFTRAYIAAGVGGGYVVGPNLLIGSWATRSFGTIGHPIPLALLLCLAVVALISTWQRRLVAVRVLALVALLGGVAATGARSALVSLLAAGLVLAVSAIRRARRHRLAATVALAAVLVALAGGVGAILLKSLASSDFSVVHRGGMVESALGLFGQPIDRVLFGFGYNAPVRLHALGILGTDQLNVVDNTLVTQLATAGVIGLVLLLGVIVLAARRGSPLVRALLAAIVASMFFFDLQSWHLVMAVFWFVVAAGAFPSRPDPVMRPLRADIAVGSI